jgi:uncharacterized protein (TIGR00297 family)
MTRRPPFSEDLRQAVHIAMGAFALTLRYLLWWEAAILAGVTVAFNMRVLPKLAAARLYRASDRAGALRSGIVLYPISIVVLLFLFGHRRDIVAAAWGILAAGDGMATIVGRRARWRPLPWNGSKTLAGSLALFLCGGAAGALLAWWCRPGVIPPPYPWFSLGAPFVAALVAAAVETIPIRLDDNVTVPFSAAATLWALSLVSEDLVASAAVSFQTALPAVIGLNAAVAAAGYAAKTVSMSGAIWGAVIGSVIFVAAGWTAWVLLLITFAGAAIASRVGLRRKTRLGIAQERGGRRGAANAIANTGFAAAAALISALSYAHEPAMIAFVAALTAAASDTIASEIGKAWGRRAFLVTTFGRVPPGTPGAVSLEGTVAGLLGAAALASAAVALNLIPTDALLPVVAAATVGAFAESVLGATLEGPGVLNNDVLNFINTAISAAAAIWFSGRM